MSQRSLAVGMDMDLDLDLNTDFINLIMDTEIVHVLDTILTTITDLLITLSMILLAMSVVLITDVFGTTSPVPGDLLNSSHQPIGNVQQFGGGAPQCEERCCPLIAKLLPNACCQCTKWALRAARINMAAF